MAKVLNSQLGQLSGKLGGMIFSRNRGGDYVRAGVKGVNPQTQAQLKARNAFASVSTLFRSLSSAEKTAWQEFADNYYSPRQGGNVGQFSAYNAFIALRSTVQQAYRKAFNPTVTVDGIALAGGQTYTDFTPMPETPLALSLTPGVATPGGDSLPLTVHSATITKDGKFDIGLQVGDGNGAQISNNVDINGNALGYAVYISNGNPSDNMAYANEFAICLGFANPWTATDPGTDLTNVSLIQITKTSAISAGEFKRFPLLDEYVNVTVLAMNKYGMFTRIGNIEVQVDNTL